MFFVFFCSSYNYINFIEQKIKNKILSEIRGGEFWYVCIDFQLIKFDLFKFVFTCYRLKNDDFDRKVNDLYICNLLPDQDYINVRIIFKVKIYGLFYLYYNFKPQVLNTLKVSLKRHRHVTC
jgi:hypothetical protein